MDESTQERAEKPLPFENLFLNSGVVHGYNSGWMYFLTVTIAMTGYFFYQALIMFPLLGRLVSNGFTHEEVLYRPELIFDSAALRLDRNIVLALILGMFVIAFLGLLTGLRLLHRKTLLSVVSAYQRFRYRRFWFAFLLWGGLITLLGILSYLISPGEFRVTFDPIGILGSLLILALLMPVQTGFEETLFRGYLMQGLSQVFRSGLPALLITSLLFGFAHMMNPEVEKYGWPVMLSYYTAFAIFLGGITLLDEGIELAFGIHLANNLVSSLISTTPDAVIKSYSFLEADAQDPYTEIVVWLCMAAFTFFIFRFRYKWKNYRLILR